MVKITTFDSIDAPSTSGSSLKGYLNYGITYYDLVKLLGEPTFLPEDSGDGKVNFEWVVEFDNGEGYIETFTIYDWKTESPEWSRLNTGSFEQAKEWFGSRWHVGGKGYAGTFINFIDEKASEKVA